MITKIIIEALNERSVSIKSQKYLLTKGIEYPIGLPHRCAYVNSDRGRSEIAAALEEPYLSAVMAVWGDTPTVIED